MSKFYAVALAVSFVLSAKFAEQVSEAILLAQESGAARDSAVRRTTTAIESAQFWRDGYLAVLKEARASNDVTREAIAGMERINTQWHAALKACTAASRRAE